MTTRCATSRGPVQWSQNRAPYFVLENILFVIHCSLVWLLRLQQVENTPPFNKRAHAYTHMHAHTHTQWVVYICCRHLPFLLLLDLMSTTICMCVEYMCSAPLDTITTHWHIDTIHTPLTAKVFFFPPQYRYTRIHTQLREGFSSSCALVCVCVSLYDGDRCPVTEL